jgi:glutamate N-acetyltransferase/amino-acid N-acetyltransferase
MSVPLAAGYRVAGVHCGIKRNPQKEDLALFFSELPAVAAGVYTQNRVFAAPVGFCRRRTPCRTIRAVVVNSGNANACTGLAGERDVEETAAAAAAACGVDSGAMLVLSTGVIGEPLPMPQVRSGIREAASRLGRDAASVEAAARAMMTTDTRPKRRSRSVSGDPVDYRLTGFAKGAAMIGPNMATMLSVILCDATLDPDDAQQALSDAVADSFNAISVDGHMSTNDSVLLLANGAAGGPPLEGASLVVLRRELAELCLELALEIVDDGEGATHRIAVRVAGCRSPEDARAIARAIANSPLVKTAVAGADPNWGRIVSAAGYAGVVFDPTRISMSLNGFLLYDHGSPAKFDPHTVSASIRDHRGTRVDITLEEGPCESCFWTTDLTDQYVRLNADYHT